MLLRSVAAIDPLACVCRKTSPRMSVDGCLLRLIVTLVSAAVTVASSRAWT
jgi:hypothetical protein